MATSLDTAAALPPHHHPAPRDGPPPAGDSTRDVLGLGSAYLDSELLEIDPDPQPITVGGLGESSAVSTAEYEHVLENGRAYHVYKEGSYPLPNDEQEQNRLDFQHRLYTLSLGGRLYAAPVGDNPPNVLDAATGTGVWAIEFARQHPRSSVLGTDLSPIQPSGGGGGLPPNVSFRISDVEDPAAWDLPVQFDFIHMRAIVTCFNDPRAVIERSFAALAPGGYLQLRDPVLPLYFFRPPDGHAAAAAPTPETSALARWNELLMKAATMAGRKFDVATNYAQWMRDAGFVDVEEHREVAPLSPWTKSRRLKYLSLWLQQNMLEVIDTLSLALFTRVLGWDVDQLKAFLVDVKREMCDVDMHAYWEGVLVWGRKPPVEAEKSEAENAPEVAAENAPAAEAEKVPEAEEPAVEKTPEAEAEKMPAVAVEKTPDLEAKKMPEVAVEKTPELEAEKTPAADKWQGAEQTKQEVEAMQREIEKRLQEIEVMQRGIGEKQQEIGEILQEVAKRLQGIEEAQAARA